MKHAKYAML